MDESRFRGAGGTDGGVGAFFLGFVMAVAGGYLLTNQVTVTSILANLDIYFRPTSLFNTLLMLVLLLGGIGLIARSLRAR